MKNRKKYLESFQGCFFRKEIKLFASLVFFLLLSTVSGFAQQTVTGTVTDIKDGLGIPGVSVLVKGTTIGTITDIDGKYSVKVESGQTLVFSFIGYDSQEIAVEGKELINVALSATTENIGEVVVVGYGTTKRSDLTGAVSSVDEKALKADVVNSLDQAMQGKASGVQVSQNSGSPSAATSVRIRGANSLANSTEPLYVIDGVPVNSDAKGIGAGFDWVGGGNGQTAVNVLSTINPADIVSIDILKDASSTAIYGSRGANGVIMVTTKKGKKGESKINYDFTYGIQTPAKLLDVMNLGEFAEYQNEIAAREGLDPRPEFADLSLVPKKGTDWQDELFDAAIVTDHNVSISGGSEKTKYSISGGYKKQDGMIQGSDFERFSGRVNISTEAKSWLSVGMNMSASKSDETLNLTDSDDGVITNALAMSPYLEVRTIDGSWAGQDENNPSGVINPIAQANEIQNSLVRTRLLGNMYANIKLHPSLTLRSEFGTDLGFTNNYSFYPFFDWGATKNEEARSRRVFANNSYWIQKNYLTFDKKINSNSIKVMLGQEAQKARWENLDGRRTKFLTNEVQELAVGGTDNQLATSIAGSSTQSSYFGRVNYDFAGKYLFTGTYRADGSSKFGPNNKWGYFPSFALAWRIMEEGFMANFDWVSNLKLRAGWGQVGNDGIGNFLYSSALKGIPTPYNTGYYYNNYPNPDVKWESATQWNVGLDFGFMNSRFTVTAEYYEKYTKDMLLLFPVPDYMGSLTGIDQGWQGIQPPFSNLGEMENKGIEVTINSVNIEKENFTWDTSINFSANKNKVTSLGIETGQLLGKVQWYDPVTRTVVGKSVGQFYGYQVDGIFQSVDEINNSPTQVAGVTSPGDIKFKDLNDDKVIDDKDRTFIGDPNPDFTYGITNNLKYKNVDVIINMNGVYGNDIFNFQRIKTEAMSDLFDNQLQVVARRWTPENPSKTIPRYAKADPNQNTRISDRYVEDGSYLRISNITLGYSLPQSFLEKTSISRLRIFAKIQNVYTFTNYSGYDPEVGSFNQNPLLTGIDNGRYPTPRTYLFGLNVSF